MLALVPARHEPHQLEQVSSHLQEVRETITLRTVMLELSAGHAMARSVLEDLVMTRKGAAGGGSYRVIRMAATADVQRHRHWVGVHLVAAAWSFRPMRGGWGGVSIRNIACPPRRRMQHQ